MDDAERQTGHTGQGPSTTLHSRPACPSGTHCPFPKDAARASQHQMGAQQTVRRALSPVPQEPDPWEFRSQKEPMKSKPEAEGGQEGARHIARSPSPLRWPEVAVEGGTTHTSFYIRFHI